jgi:hypothetical protein
MSADPRRATPGVGVIATAAFVVAFVVRLVWILRVQSPFDAVYSDMGGYVARADELLAHRMPPDPRLLTMYPFGTHYLLALEFLVFGREARLAIAIVHALVGAVPAACAPVLMVRLVPRRWAAVLAAALVALWYPQIAFAGFFSSELWFSAFIALHACLAVSAWNRPRRSLGGGVAAALAFVVRPQFMLTWLVAIAGQSLSLVRRRGLWRGARGVAWVVLPLALAVGGSSTRLHRLSGHWGLIAESGINRVWADTDLCKVASSWHPPGGGTLNYWFSPPSKQPCPDSRGVSFTGFIADPVILDKIRRDHLRGVSWARRVWRMGGNVRLLLDRNLPWPESNYRDPWRYALQKWFAIGIRAVILPLCVAGLVLGPRNATMLILAANLVTVVVAAAIFFGEARYHVPYDPFGIVLAIAGGREVVVRVRNLVRRRRFRLTRSVRAIPRP